MSRRKAFFESLPGKIHNFADGESRLEIEAEIALPSGATCKKLIVLRLGRVHGRKGHGYTLWHLVARDGETKLGTNQRARWRALEELILKQGGIEHLVRERALEIGAIYKKTRSWELALPL